MFHENQLPQQLCGALKVLVNAHICNTNPAPVEKTEIAEAKEYLADGIELSNSATTRLYQVVVYMPEPGKEEERITFFKLVPLYPGCVMRRLEEV